MLGDINEFHTEYVLDDALYDFINDEQQFALSARPPYSQGNCVRFLSVFQRMVRNKLRTKRSTPELKQLGRELLARIKRDVEADPKLLDYPVCSYRAVVSAIPHKDLVLRAHERFHALVGYMRKTNQFVRYVKPKGEEIPKVMYDIGVATADGMTMFPDERFRRALNAFGTATKGSKFKVGDAFYWVSIINGWDSEDGLAQIEEVLARMAEYSAVQKTKDKAQIAATENMMAMAMERTESRAFEDLLRPAAKRKYPQGFHSISFRSTDFEKLYRRIIKAHGSIEGFVRFVAAQTEL